MNPRRGALLFLLAVMTASCSEKSASSKSEPETQKSEAETQPREDEIAEDCVTFVRATKVVSEQTPGAECAGCSKEGGEVLTFRQMHMDRVSCSANSCEVRVTLRASFNPGPGGTVTGGLTAWISQEQRQAYRNGHAPEGEQDYAVKIIYKRTGESWRAIEFDKAD